jgi:hypothetical protein
VADRGGSETDALCEDGRSFFDLATPVYTAVASNDGFSTATVRLVPTPVTGNVKLFVVQNAGGFYLELRPYNYRAGITKLEVQRPGSTTWMALPRTSYNSFVYSGDAIGSPLSVRVTSRFGESITFPPADLPANARIIATAQFVTFPEIGPAPIWVLPPVYVDSFNNMTGGSWAASPFGGASVNASYTADFYRGTASLRLSDLSPGAGVAIGHQQRFTRPVNGVFEFAIKSESGSGSSNLAVLFSGVDASGAAVSSAPVTLPVIGHSWRVIRISLQAAEVPAKITSFQIMNSSSVAAATVLLDQISFLQL